MRTLALGVALLMGACGFDGVPTGGGPDVDMLAPADSGDLGWTCGASPGSTCCDAGTCDNPALYCDPEIRVCYVCDRDTQVCL